VAAGSALWYLGFQGAGIAAGSVAAGIQAGMGNVAGGSLFAYLQTLGALGMPLQAVIIGALAFAIGTAAKVYGWYKELVHEVVSSGVVAGVRHVTNGTCPGV
jgi:hypothetical protein